MPRVSSLDGFSRELDEELTWRKREISDMRRAIGDAEGELRGPLLRAFVPLLYAHWEGFSQASAKKYFSFITQQRLRVDALNEHYGNLIFLRRIDALSSASSSQDEKLKLISEIRSAGSLRFSRVHEKLIDTGANLNVDRMLRLCQVCGIDPSFVIEKRELIDVRLLKRRNGIAHGEWMTIPYSEIHDLSSEVLALMQNFRNLLENSIATESFRVGH